MNEGRWWCAANIHRIVQRALASPGGLRRLRFPRVRTAREGTTVIRIEQENASMKTVTQTQLDGLALFRRGKVRDVYEISDRLLIIATDRLSAFDVVLPDPIPMKGAVLTMISRFWFEKTGGI